MYLIVLGLHYHPVEQLARLDRYTVNIQPINDVIPFSRKALGKLIVINLFREGVSRMKYLPQPSMSFY